MSKFRVLNFKFKLYYFNFKKITLSNEMNNFVSQLLLATYITKNRKKEKKSLFSRIYYGRISDYSQSKLSIL